MSNINQISPDGGTTLYDIEDTDARNDISSLQSTKANVSDLGTAAYKNSTSVVTDGSDLVESGAVYDGLASQTQLLDDTVGWIGKNFDNPFRVNTQNNVSYTKENNGYHLTMSAATTYGQAYFWYDDLPKNTDITVKCDVDFTSGVGLVVVTGCNSLNVSERVNIANSDVISEDKTVELSFNTGNYTYIIIFLSASGGTSIKGEVAYNNYIICRSDLVDKSFEPYHASVEDTLRDATLVNGKNILPYFTEVKSGSGVTVTPNNGRYSFAGTATGNITLKYPVTIEASGVLKFLATGSTEGNGTNIRLYLKDKSTQATSTLMSGNTVDLSVYDITDIAFYAGNGKTPSFNNIGLMLQDASNPDTTFVPYYIPLKDVVPTKADNSVIGTVEGANASKAWSVGEHFISGGQFKEVTNPIASGEAINSGNTTNKPIADLLNVYSTTTIADIFDTYTNIGTMSFAKVGKSIQLGVISTENAAQSGAFTTLGVLKSEYRPLAQMNCIALASSGKPVGWVRVQTNGTVDVAQSEGSAIKVIFGTMYICK